MPVSTKTAPTQKRGSSITISSREGSKVRTHSGTLPPYPRNVMSIAPMAGKVLLPDSGISKSSVNTGIQLNGAGMKPLSGIYPALGGYECQM